jgi:hypothetical protein
VAHRFLPFDQVISYGGRSILNATLRDIRKDYLVPLTVDAREIVRDTMFDHMPGSGQCYKLSAGMFFMVVVNDQGHAAVTNRLCLAKAGESFSGGITLEDRLECILEEICLLSVEGAGDSGGDSFPLFGGK